MIYIVTPVYNRREFTRSYLQALSSQTVQNFKTIIVDDGSTDDTVEMIENEFHEVILLKEKGDLWWAAATNIGVKYALEQNDVDYIMTLNDDTLPAVDYIEKMILHSKEYPDALLGAFTVDANTGENIYGGHVINWSICANEDLLKAKDIKKFEGLYEVNVYPGRGLLIPKKVFEDIGFYDEKNFPQTVADLDFTVRATNFGYKIYSNYDAKIKEYPEESGGISIRKKKSWKNYYTHLFGYHGAGNLIWFTKFVIKNAPRKYLVQCLFFGISRRVGGYLRDWIKEIIR